MDEVFVLKPLVHKFSVFVKHLDAVIAAIDHIHVLCDRIGGDAVHHVRSSRGAFRSAQYHFLPTPAEIFRSPSASPRGYRCIRRQRTSVLSGSHVRKHRAIEMHGVHAGLVELSLWFAETAFHRARIWPASL